MTNCDVKEQTRRRFCVARRVPVGVAVATGTVLAGVGSVSAASTPEEEAGAALTGMATDGATWLGTYGVPAIATMLGIGLVLALFIKLGRRVRGAA